MATTISSGASSFTPELVLGWNANQTSGNILHTIIGRTDPDVTLKAATLRSGTLEFLFLTSTAATAARAILEAGAAFSITADETWLTGFDFVLSGNLSSVLEDVTRNLWTISADFQEIIP